MKIFSFIFWFSLWQGVCLGNELIIEVTTDKYPNETSWKVFDTEKNLILENGTLLKNTTYRDTLDIPSEGCYFWRIYDSYGNGLSNGTPPGDFKIFLDGNLVAFCENPDFGDSLTIYGLGNGCVTTDVSLESLDFSENQAFNPFDVTFTVLNFGSETITSLLVAYEIGGWEYEPVLLDSLLVEFGQSKQLSLPEKLQLTTEGEAIFGFQILKVNGQEDLNLNNNFLQKNILVSRGYWKKPLHEEFTANWCGPCALANPVLKATFDQFPGQYSLIKYQYYNDTYFHADGGRMATFYGVSGVPAMYIDGSYFYPGDYTPEEFQMHIGQISPVLISLYPMAVGDSLFVEAILTSVENLSSDVYLRLAVVENTTSGNIGTNGEDEFENVFMKFLSNWAGDEVGQLQANQPVEFTFKTRMDDTFVEEMNDLSMVGYLFNKESYTIIQSEMVVIPYSPAAPVITFSIENGSETVEPDVTLTIESDKALVNLDNSEIDGIESIIDFNESNPEGPNVAFTGTISDTKKTITLTPVSPLKPNTKYVVGLSGVKSDEGIEVTNATIGFTTKPAVVVLCNENQQLTIFPNPVSNVLYLQSKASIEASLTDVSGRILRPLESISGTVFWDLSGFQPGVYYVVTILESKKIYQKIIVY